MNTLAIKTFIAAHKTAIGICAVVLVIGSKSFTQSFEQGFNDSYYGQQNQYGQNPQQQQQQQNQGFFGRWFGGNNANANQNSNQGQANQGYANNQPYYPSTGGNYTAPANNSGADITSGYAAQQASQDRTSANFSDYMRDQGNYDDGNGNTYKMNSNYSNNYVNNTTGEALQTNDASYDPNAGSTSTWSAVTPTPAAESGE